MQVNIPASLLVYVPALDREVTVSTEACGEAEILAMLQHGLKQKLTDAAAGKPEKAEELVAKRLETVWSLNASRGPKADPVLVEIRKLVMDNADKLKVIKKQVPAKMAEFKAWYESRRFGGDEEKDIAIRRAIETKAQAIVATRQDEIDFEA